MQQFVAPHVDLPAVLVEVGFIDHPIQGKELAEPTV
jgi:N-acetylmuramoyl-L-alanine amidase